MKRFIALFLAIIFLIPSVVSCSLNEQSEIVSGSETLGIESETEAVTEPETEVLNSEKVNTVATFEIPAKLSNVGSDKSIALDVLFQNNMVLQANMPVRVWGTAKKNEKICARLTNITTKEVRTFYSEVVDREFEIWLGSTEHGGDYKLEIITESGKRLILAGILFGEVYILGGQSNMGWYLGQCYGKTTNELRYADIIANCKNNQIREMLVWPVSAVKPVEKLSNIRGWRPLSPSNAPEVSACGFFFARRLQDKLDVPVGIISSCMGGTPISQWYPGAEWYNGMIEPIKKLIVRGVLWYQGEGDNVKYADRLAEMITLWREAFENPNMLFHVVQLPRYTNESTWYKCREEQKKVTTLVDRCTYSVNIDTGMLPHMTAKGDTLNADAIHPYQKLEVGERAADVLLEKFYGLEGTWTSPYLSSAELDNDGSVILHFDNVGKGLMLEGLAGFEVAAKVNKYVDAKPEIIDASTVKLTFEGLTEDVRFVRYGYSNSSSFIKGKITDCAQCVCLYNTVGDDSAKGYPAEQFTYKFE